MAVTGKSAPFHPDRMPRGVEHDLVAGGDIALDKLAAFERQHPLIDRVAVKQPSEGFSDQQLDAGRAQRACRGLASRAVAETFAGHQCPAAPDQRVHARADLVEHVKDEILRPAARCRPGRILSVLM